MGNIVDPLGRFTIPIKFRKMMNINYGDELDVVYQKGTLLIRKSDQTCVFCEGAEELFSFEERMICKECLEKLKEKQKQTGRNVSKVSIHYRTRGR